VTIQVEYPLSLRAVEAGESVFWCTVFQINPQGVLTMEITILGSGTCVPSLRRSSPCILVNTGAMKMLLDTGPGSLHQMLKVGITINDIDLIVYSHFHVDHTAEMAPFIFASMYAPETFRRRPLTIMGPRG